MATKSAISTIDDQAPDAPALDTVAAKGMWIVTIAESSEDGGDRPLFVSGGDKRFLIPRGKPFPVPVEIVNALKTAVVSTFKSGPDGVVTEIKTPAIAFTAVPA